MIDYGYTFDYTKTMMMKMKLSDPDQKGGSTVYISIDKALEIIRSVDNLTLGTPKIIYLVGWQYFGHDDKYPDFFEANPYLKRAQDKCANDSILWLINEAKKYNTTVSFHINFNDAYQDAPSFNDYLAYNALIRKKNGKPNAIECYNGKKCYKICLKTAWESGLFKRQVDKLLKIFPIEQLGTVHIDNFQCYTNYAPKVTIAQMSAAREQMINYLREKGIDITSEFTYRESKKMPNKPILGLPREHSSNQKIATLGKIPAVWWYAYMKKSELIDIPPQLFGGGMFRKDIRDFGRIKYLYGNIHGEELFEKMAQGNKSWSKEFLTEYATIQLPYQFLCQYKRLSISGNICNNILNCSDNVSSHQKGSKIFVGDICIKDGNNLCIPLIHQKNTFLAYSYSGDCREWKFYNIDNSIVKLYDISESGLNYIGTDKIQSGKLTLSLNPQQAILIQMC